MLGVVITLYMYLWFTQLRMYYMCKVNAGTMRVWVYKLAAFLTSDVLPSAWTKAN